MFADRENVGGHWQPIQNYGFESDRIFRLILSTTMERLHFQPTTNKKSWEMHVSDPYLPEKKKTNNMTLCLKSATHRVLALSSQVGEIVVQCLEIQTLTEVSLCGSNCWPFPKIGICDQGSQHLHSHPC